ncbi:class I adenylate-forming enzyme family protein [Bauldia litoralis]|uniref:Amino acid adenylation domain-containing protein n=1 Tax=Bauldia litoralis TaxID=665467 RepID=A0A1G6AH72_9HYPH|nr:AMP-binding protein [Bauldia litoralis]SDB07656.1 amino acid adenylation domain-containing protein [Bauldia litoralis]
MRVEQFLRNSARRLPEKEALVAGTTRLSYAELDLMSDRLAAALLARGIAQGDRVVIFTDNCFEAVVSIFAVLKAGAVFVPINPSTKADKLAYVLENCRAAALVTQGRLAATAALAMVSAPSVGFLALIGGKGPATAGALSFEEAVTDETPVSLPAPGITLDLAMLVYTSGSTGFPKGVMMTHQNVVAAAGSITTYLENREDDVILGVLPISFDYGLYQVLMAAMVGATLVLEKSFAFPQAILNRMSEERVTGLPLVPTMAAIILQMRDLEPGSFPHLRYVTNTAAALPPSHIARLQALFPSARIFSMYGLTECKRCTYLPPEELARRPDSVGIAIPGTQAYVADDEGKPVAPGVIGELMIRGPHVMRGYWENPDATDRALRPGPYPWEKVLRTGDFFRADADGFLYFIGRMDDIIKTRGEKVSPKEVENVLYALPGIAEAVVVGVADPILGHALKAVIALSPGASLSERDILRHCSTGLEDFMVPKFIEFRDALPKTDSGKISRRLIEEEMLEAAE